VLHHAGQLHQPLQGQFPPPAAHLGTPQGLDQVAGLLLQLLLGQGQALQVLAQRPVGLPALFFYLVDLPFGFLQRRLDGVDQLLHRLFLAGQLVTLAGQFLFMAAPLQLQGDVQLGVPLPQAGDDPLGAQPGQQRAMCRLQET